MKLYYSPTSPYSRKVRLLAMAHDLDLEILVTNPLEDDPEFLKVNPLAKVPTLIARQHAIFDSPVIAEYLLKEAGADRTTDTYLKQLETQALADGVMDAAVATVMEKRRQDSEQSAHWLSRWENAIDRSLAVLEKQVDTVFTSWDLASISVACMLDYLCFRRPDILWQEKYPRCAYWHAEVSRRPDMKATDPR